jgi:hypothetical protein
MTPITTVTAERSREPLPRWARLERKLFATLDTAWRAFDRRYAEPDGRLRFAGSLGLPPDNRDGVDDFYEPFFNWPQLYLLGGADDLLEASKTHWNGVTAQLTEMGMLTNEYEKGYDWFHQGESLLFFYFLCLSDPCDPEYRSRALRFADLYMNASHGNYDPVLNIITAPHTGAEGPRQGFLDAAPHFPWVPALRPYGLPLDWIQGVSSFDDLLADPDLALQYGTEMWNRMGRGDVAVNLAATSLAANAYLLSGDQKYKDWVLKYAAGWLERSDSLGGILPDNVGLSGQVGEYVPHWSAATTATSNWVAVRSRWSFARLSVGGLTPKS